MIHRREARFDINHPNLCPGLRWKGQFISAAHDETVQPCIDGLFWCMYTQTCIGPDGVLAEPGNCCSGERGCHSNGKCE
jgi:hypothetical protein